ncbi:MAG TPA: biotin/lipoyl-containing protein [Vicinamibacterales bacterium]|jgi:biotin carboxyl carrier protein
MTFEIDLDGTRRAVSIEPAGQGRFRVVVLGEPRTVRAERTSEFGLSLTLDEASGRSREVTVTPGSNGELLVGLGGRTVSVSVDGRRRRGGGDGGRDTAGEQAVVAPMPGRVVRVLVSRGDEVAARQSVVVVEAMKMENELRSPKAGRIKEVAVGSGTLVEAGRVLVVVE